MPLLPGAEGALILLMAEQEGQDEEEYKGRGGRMERGSIGTGKKTRSGGEKGKRERQIEFEEEQRRGGKGERRERREGKVRKKQQGYREGKERYNKKNRGGTKEKIGALCGREEEGEHDQQRKTRMRERRGRERYGRKRGRGGLV